MVQLKVLSGFSLIKGTMQLIRLPNILIIVLTQVLLRYCIMLPFLYSNAPGLISPFSDFVILVIVTVLIAIGGYVINDYFDVKIDGVNRPEKLIVNKLISSRGAIKVHLVLNGIAVFLGFYLAWRVKAISFGFVFPFISGLLWIYSAKYKRMLLWGNFIVAALSAFVILVIWLFEFFWLRLNPAQFANVLPAIYWVTRIFMAYAVFAFLVSMVREIVKDMEDAEGDASVGCRTLPLVVGMKYSRVIAAAILLVTIILLGFSQIILYRLSLYMAFWYFALTVQLLALYLMIKLWQAREKQDYHFLSSLCKLIMITGILSMEILFISQ